MKEGFFLDQIIVPIALFVVTTDNPPREIELVSSQDIPEHLVGRCLSELGTPLRGGGTPLNNQTNVFRLLEVCLGRSKRVV